MESQLLNQRKETEDLWTNKKEEFIKSKEFAVLCSEKVLEVFELGFNWWVTQLKANWYGESKKPCPFLSSD